MRRFTITGVLLLQLEKLADNLPERQVNPWRRAGWRSLCLHYLLNHAVLPAIAEEGMVRECTRVTRVRHTSAGHPVRLTSVAASSRSSREASRL